MESGIIKQPKGSADCVACVAAMATGTTVAKFKSVFGQEGPYNDVQFIAYMLMHGYWVGIGSSIQQGQPFDPFKQVLTPYIDLEQFQAYVVVKSQTLVGKDHAVYWTGSEIWDPAPHITKIMPLDFYDVVAVFPITKFSDDMNLGYGVRRRMVAEIKNKMKVAV